jgi:hypothetical protein
LKARGWGAALNVALDALEPLGPLGAQALWVFQPLSGLFGAREVVRDIALALEEPGGIEHLRQELEK